MLRFFTSGESHGKGLIAIIEGLPSGLKINIEKINKELKRRQQGYGRGERMKKIEKDRVEILSGIRWGETTGSPVTFFIPNKDYENWKEILSVYEKDRNESLFMTKPRPGHADLSGAMKFLRRDLRDVLERSSARETAARVAIGAICKIFLKELNIKIVSFTKEIAGIRARAFKLLPEEIELRAESSPLRCLDPVAERKMKMAIDEAKKNGDTLGGVFTVCAYNVPTGLGSNTQWDLKIDGRIAQAMMSIPAVKGVEIGRGFDGARKKGSLVHDPICWSKEKGFYRTSNNAGGVEGGITNGEPIIVRCALKPIPSLLKPLQSIDIKTKEETLASIVRSDICVVPAAGIIGESMLSFVIAREIKEKFGGDSIEELKNNFNNYLELINKF